MKNNMIIIVLSLIGCIITQQGCAPSCTIYINNKGVRSASPGCSLYPMSSMGASTIYEDPNKICLRLDDIGTDYLVFEGARVGGIFPERYLRQYQIGREYLVTVTVVDGMYTPLYLPSEAIPCQ